MKIPGRVLLLFCCLILGGILMVAWHARRQEASAPPASARLSPAARPATALAPHVAATAAPMPSTAKRFDKNDARPDAGTGEFYLEHHFRSFIDANRDELALRPEEVDRLVADLLEYQEIHAELALRHMQETGGDAASLVVHVPPFPAQGKALRELMERRLETDFPNGVAERIRDRMGTFVDDSFRGFGVTDQTFSIRRSAEIPDSFEIAWEARPPEDQTPNGLARDTTYGGSSGTMLFSRDQVKFGEYRFLSDLIERKFPADSASH